MKLLRVKSGIRGGGSGLPIGQGLKAAAQNVAISTDNTVAISATQLAASLGVLSASNANGVTVARGDNWTLFRTSGVGTAGILVSATARRWRWLYATNADAAAYYLMAFDKGSAAVNGDTPILQVRIAPTGNTNFSVIDLGLDGVTLVNGLSIAFSSTQNTLTLSLAASMTVAAETST